MNDQQRYTAKVSCEAVSTIDEMVRSPHFQFLIERLKAREEELRASILNDDMSAEAREALRQRRLELMDVINLPERERRTHVSILASFGIAPGDGFEIGL